MFMTTTVLSHFIVNNYSTKSPLASGASSSVKNLYHEQKIENNGDKKEYGKESQR